MDQSSVRIVQDTSPHEVPRALNVPVSANELTQFKSQTEYKILVLQRLVQEIRNKLRVMDMDMDEAEARMKVTDDRLLSVEREVAKQTDSNSMLKQEMEKKDAARQRELEKRRRDYTELKEALGAIEITVAALGRNTGPDDMEGASGEQSLRERQMFSLQRLMLEDRNKIQVMRDLMDARWETFENFQIQMETSSETVPASLQVQDTRYNGVIVWPIDNYTRRKEDARDGRTLSLYSQPFYTSRHGYKMCARIYLNGDGMGKGTHISLFFVVMKGEYDAILPWPFRQKVTLMLMDQGANRRDLSEVFRPDPSSSSFKRPTSDMNIASGCPLFVQHSVVEGSDYKKDDKIFVRLVIDTSDLENM